MKITINNTNTNKEIADTVLVLNNIKKTFSQKIILNNLNLTIGQGEFITIVGPSGCGKTTILRLIAGLDSPDLGEIYLNNDNITMLPAEERPLHTIFQSYALFPHMNVFDNIAFGLRMKGISEEIIKKSVIKTLSSVHLDGYQDKMPSNLSGGESQRVAIARAIINKPKLLLLDECLSALDYNLRRRMQNELKSMQRKLGIPFVFVTHDQEEALSLADRIIVLRDGRIEQQGSPRSLYENPINIFVAKFIGDGNIFKAKVVKILSKYEILAVMEGKSFKLSCKDYLQSRKDKTINDLIDRDIYVLLRPEDLRITELDKNEKSNNLTGIILERNYKGMTLESVIKLDSGKIILSSEFFNEDDPDVDHQLLQKVEITWVNGWEVLLDE